MSWRWLVLDYVDPELRLTPEERKAVRRKAWSLRSEGRADGERPPKRNLDLLGAILVADLLFAMAVLMFFWRGSTTFLWFAMPVQIVLAWLLFAWLGRISWRPYVYEALNELGHLVCQTCGYPRQGLDASLPCPECGATWHAEEKA